LIVNVAARGPAPHCEFIHKLPFAQIGSNLGAEVSWPAAHNAPFGLHGGACPGTFAPMTSVCIAQHHVHHHHGLAGRGDMRVRG